MTPEAIEVFQRTCNMMEKRGATYGDYFALTAMMMSFLCQKIVAENVGYSRDRVEYEIVMKGREADELVQIDE